jgi:hypothetical protein
MIAASIAFLTRDASSARLDCATRGAAVVALLCILSASPAHSQMLGLRAAACAQSPETVVANGVEEASRRFHVPAAWVRAVMRAESQGDAKSVSEKGAIGLMQVMPKTYADLQARLGLGPNPFDPHDNILAGAAYLAEMFERYGESGFLVAYNAGPRRYEDYLHGRPLPEETTNYVARLAPELGIANVLTVRIPAPFDALHSSLFVALTTEKLTQEMTADGGVNNVSRNEGAVPYALFPARPDTEIFARDWHSGGPTNASLRGFPSYIADHFVRRRGPESAR